MDERSARERFVEAQQEIRRVHLLSTSAGYPPCTIDGCLTCGAQRQAVEAFADVNCKFCVFLYENDGVTASKEHAACRASLLAECGLTEGK